MIRLNRWVAGATDLSRRGADEAIKAGRVSVNGQIAQLGTAIDAEDKVTLDGQPLKLREHSYILLNKPTGYVCSRRQQGKAPTVYSLLPEPLRHLNTVGRLDKDSSGLLLLTDDGDLAQKLSHPGHEKEKQYAVTLHRALSAADKAKIEEGITLYDGPSSLKLSGSGKTWQVAMHEGRNRQIRRTFEAAGYTVVTLHRTRFGSFSLGKIKAGEYQAIMPEGL